MFYFSKYFPPFLFPFSSSLSQGGTLTNWVKRLSTNKKIKKSNIILEVSRHPKFMNPFEYGESFHKKSFPKRIGTLTPFNPKIFMGAECAPRL